jgi:hypothetical protein
MVNIFTPTIFILLNVLIHECYTKYTSGKKSGKYKIKYSTEFANFIRYLYWLRTYRQQKKQWGFIEWIVHYFDLIFLNDI